MKTYNEYLQIIKDREYKEQQAEIEKARKWNEEHPESYCITGEISRMTFDYSVEIMGMMMEDFLQDFGNLLKEEKKMKNNDRK